MLLAREEGSSSREPSSGSWRRSAPRRQGSGKLGASEAIKRAARAGLGVAFLSRYAVAEEVARGDLESFRLAGRPPMLREFSIARVAGKALAPSERGFVATLTRCCAKSADYAESCVGAPPS